MSKKADPVLAVLRYFRETELPLAQQALAMATATVRERGPSGPKRNNDVRSKTRVVKPPLPTAAVSSPD